MTTLPATLSLPQQTICTGQHLGYALNLIHALQKHGGNMVEQEQKDYKKRERNRENKLTVSRAWGKHPAPPVCTR